MSKTAEIHNASEKIYCAACVEKAIEKITRGTFAIKEFEKIKAVAFVKKKGKLSSKTLVGLNEVQVHNSNHIHAVRFDFCLNGVCLKEEVIGDGVVAATAFGSTAYFYAITHK